ncbi:hypothetical protein CBS101457_000215 [Exobasidium rhododendri]|nr:hypothetical protein CBS101457_000215 [Exobasidium rhododendri]
MMILPSRATTLLVLHASIVFASPAPMYAWPHDMISSEYNIQQHAAPIPPVEFHDAGEGHTHNMYPGDLAGMPFSSFPTSTPDWKATTHPYQYTPSEHNFDHSRAELYSSFPDSSSTMHDPTSVYLDSTYTPYDRPLYPPTHQTYPHSYYQPQDPASTSIYNHGHTSNVHHIHGESQPVNYNIQDFHPHLQKYASQLDLYTAMTFADQHAGWNRSPSPPPREQPSILSSSPSPSPSSGEYALHVDSHFHFSRLDDLVYRTLSEDQKAFILERVHQVRPYLSGSVRKKLYEKLNVPLAKQFLSGDETEVEKAIEKIYPYSAKKYGLEQDSWMAGFSEAARRQIIVKLAEATGQKTNEVADIFLNRNMDSDTAAKIMKATPDQCVMIAVEHDLILPESIKDRPWQKRLSPLQVRALFQRMMLYGGVATEEQCVPLLRSSCVPDAYGVTLLKASDAAFEQMMRALWEKTRML